MSEVYSAAIFGGCREGILPSQTGETPARQPAGRRRYMACAAVMTSGITLSTSASVVR
jgi:hypothetical protein